MSDRFAPPSPPVRTRVLLRCDPRAHPYRVRTCEDRPGTLRLCSARTLTIGSLDRDVTQQDPHSFKAMNDLGARAL